MAWIGMAAQGTAGLLNGIIGSKAAKDSATTIAHGADAVSQSLNNATAAGQAGTSTAVGNAQSQMSEWSGNANNALGTVFNSQTANLNPYLQTGTQGATALQQMMAPGGALTTQFAAPSEADVQNTPGYQFAYDQGQKALANSAAARGGAISGGAIKGSEAYGTGLANQYYSDAYNRALTTFQTNRTNTLNGIQAMTNLGQFGTQQYNQAAQNYGNNISSNDLNAAHYMGNTGIQGAEYNGNLGLQGANLAGNMWMQGVYGTAAGQMGATNAWENSIQQQANAISSGMGGGGGGMGGGGGGMGGGGGG